MPIFLFSEHIKFPKYTICQFKRSDIYLTIIPLFLGNIPGSEVSKGEVLTDFVGSGPPKGSGLHRYVFVLYKQPERINFTDKKISSTTGTGRGKFSIRDFAKKYNLGKPLAYNVYQAEWDDYVPKLHKQLTN